MLALNIGEILREFGEFLGKYRILYERSMGSIGLISHLLGTFVCDLCLIWWWGVTFIKPEDLPRGPPADIKNVYVNILLVKLC